MPLIGMSTVPQDRVCVVGQAVQSHTFSCNSKIIVHVTVKIAIVYLHLMQLLDCYWYNYSQITLKCVRLPMLATNSLPTNALQYDCILFGVTFYRFELHDSF